MKKDLETAIKAFRKRRLRRVLSRFDADEESNNSGGGGKHSGNMRIPFGLCLREGITIGKDWGPSEAWEALEGKGITSSEVYSRLKETGSVDGRKKRSPTKLEEKHFPSAMMTKSAKSTTMAVMKMINEKCDDGNITDFIGSGVGAGTFQPKKGTKCSRSSTGDVKVRSIYSATTKELQELQVSVPMFSDKDSELSRTEKVREFIHEYTHYLDFLGRKEDKIDSCFTEHEDELKDAILKDNGKISDEVMQLFKDFNAEHDRLEKEFTQKHRAIPKELANAKYGEIKPDWMNDNGYINLYEAVKAGQYSEAMAFKKERDKMMKSLMREYSDKQRCAIEGVSCLQGIYDSISGGEHREKGIVKYGHSRDYFKNVSHRMMETLADYVALKATNPKMAEMFVKDKPEIARRLDDTVVEMTKWLKEAR